MNSSSSDVSEPILDDASQNVIKEDSGNVPATTDERYNLPTFEDWIHKRLDTLPENQSWMVKSSAMFYGLMHTLTLIRLNLRKIALENNGLKERPEDSEEFKKAMKEFYYFYQKVMLIRSFILRYYDFLPPNWATEICPEKFYCGVLLSDEDFEKVLCAPESGLTKLVPDSEKKYQEDLEKEAREQEEEEEKNIPSLEQVD